MNCPAIRSRLDDYLDGYSPAMERTAVELHLRSCRGCGEALRETGELRRRLRALPVPRPDMGRFSLAIAAAAEAESTRRWQRNLRLTGGALAASLVLALGLNLPDEPAPSLAAVESPAERNLPVSVPTAAPEEIPDASDSILAGPTAPPDEALAIAVALHEEREIGLELESQRRIEEATFTVQLPEGLELAGYPGQREIRWHGHLESGRNLLVLPIRVQAGRGGELIAHIADTERERSLTLRMEVTEPLPPAPSVPSVEPVTVM